MNTTNETTEVSDDFQMPPYPPGRKMILIDAGTWELTKAQADRAVAMEAAAAGMKPITIAGKRYVPVFPVVDVESFYFDDEPNTGGQQ